MKFLPGDSIQSTDDDVLTISKVIEIDGLLTYITFDENKLERQIVETDLNHHIQFNKPQDRFFTGQIDSGSWFNLRYETWRNIQQLQQSTISGLFGGRTALIPHQLYIAHEAANRYILRIMLADEVGLGKTIEAGLILHHRLISGRTQRALILVPESLIHQWFVEMLRRFNLHFSIFDEERCLETHDDNPFLSEQLFLCSTEFFSSYPERQQQALNADWDMVIVDEAQHLEWNESNPGSEYQFVESLALLTPALILLTATPEQLGKESHYARLRLLDPDRFYSFENFIKEEKEFTPVAKAANFLLKEKIPDTDLLNTLKALLKQDNVENLLESLNKPAEAGSAREELINILMDHHGTGRVLFRNSRHTVKGFPERQRFAYPLPGEEPESKEIHLTQRFLWLVNLLEQLQGDKALLICKHAKTVLDLEQTLKNHAGIYAAVFHEGMSIIDRDRASAWFADMESKAKLLICSEIGSEGRNFQFSKHLILFDLPENPDLLQQRIGRLDRIGQKHIIQIHIPFIENSSEHLLFRWYDEGMDAFRRNCSAAQRIYELQVETLHELLQTHDREKIESFIAETHILAKQIETELHDGRDQLLEINSCRDNIAQDLISQIKELENKQTLWPFMEKLLDCYGVEVEYHSPDCHILKPGNHLRISHFPELPEDGKTITVNRDIALTREDMEFLTWEHPMVSAAMDLVLSSDTGNAAISVVKHQDLKIGEYLLETLYIVECSAPADLQIGRFLPPTPIRVLTDQHGDDFSTIVSHSSLLETGQTIEIAQMSGFLVDHRKNIEEILAIAKTVAKQEMFDLVKLSCEDMLDTLGSEIKRLSRLKKVNPNITKQEVDQLKEITRLSFDSIQSARLKLDAVRLIIST